MNPLHKANAGLALDCALCDMPIHVGQAYVYDPTRDANVHYRHIADEQERRTKEMLNGNGREERSHLDSYHLHWLSRIAAAGHAGMRQTPGAQDDPPTIPNSTATVLVREHLAYRDGGRVHLTASGVIRLRELRGES